MGQIEPANRTRVLVLTTYPSVQTCVVEGVLTRGHASVRAFDVVHADGTGFGHESMQLAVPRSLTQGVATVRAPGPTTFRPFTLSVFYSVRCRHALHICRPRLRRPLPNWGKVHHGDRCWHTELERAPDEASSSLREDYWTLP